QYKQILIEKIKKEINPRINEYFQTSFFTTYYKIFSEKLKTEKKLDISNISFENLTDLEINYFKNHSESIIQSVRSIVLDRKFNSDVMQSLFRESCITTFIEMRENFIPLIDANITFENNTAKINIFVRLENRSDFDKKIHKLLSEYFIEPIASIIQSYLYDTYGSLMHWKILYEV
ncbi:MAG TPA: hypothetical protein VN704_10750, partial [Verrucomicrobiae bacterium]|nr:hypothetical protein [Verrucomicrobiae bacterium]